MYIYYNCLVVYRVTYKVTNMIELATTMLNPDEKKYVEKIIGYDIPTDVSNIECSKMDGITDAILNSTCGKPDDEKNFAMNTWMKFMFVNRGN